MQALDARADRVAAIVARRFGVEPPVLLRRGMNHVYRAGEVVIRIGEEGGDASRQVAISEVLIAAGIPCLVSVGPPDVIDALPVSVWRYIDHDVGIAIDYRQAGQAVARLHQISPDAFDDVDSVGGLPWCAAPTWLDIDRNLRTVEQRALLADDDAAKLRRACDALADWQSRALDDTDLAVCHGDLHPQNLIAGVHGVVIIDWDNICVGPPAWDHALLLTWASRWGGPPHTYSSFAEGYGADLSQSPLAVLLAEVRLLSATINMIIAGEHDESRAIEAEKRMRYWLGDPEAPAWTAQPVQPDQIEHPPAP